MPRSSDCDRGHRKPCEVAHISRCRCPVNQPFNAGGMMDGFGRKAEAERKRRSRGSIWELLGVVVLLFGVIAVAVACQN